MEKQKR